jgi:hypothetical protein
MTNNPQVRTYARQLTSDAQTSSANQSNARHQLRVLKSLAKQNQKFKQQG